MDVRITVVMYITVTKVVEFLIIHSVINCSVDADQQGQRQSFTVNIRLGVWV